MEGKSGNVGYRMGKACSRPHNSSPIFLPFSSFMTVTGFLVGGKESVAIAWGLTVLGATSQEAQQITTIQSGIKVINKPSRRIPSCYPMLLCIICLDF